MEILVLIVLGLIGLGIVAMTGIAAIVLDLAVKLSLELLMSWVRALLAKKKA